VIEEKKQENGVQSSYQPERKAYGELKNLIETHRTYEARINNLFSGHRYAEGYRKLISKSQKAQRSYKEFKRKEGELNLESRREELERISHIVGRWQDMIEMAKQHTEEIEGSIEEIKRLFRQEMSDELKRTNYMGREELTELLTEDLDDILKRSEQALRDIEEAERSISKAETHIEDALATL
jgi:hypothetical protein